MKRIITAIAAIILVSAFLSACSESDTATTSAQCGWVVGNGKHGNDANVHDVVYPGETVKLDEDSYGDSEVFLAIPCNSRNWLDNPEGSVDANGNAIGDYHVAMEGVTSDKTKVLVWLSMFWTPNQTESIMKDRWFPFCEKYNCFSSGEEINNSSKGWNDMLGENVPGAVNAAVRLVMPQFDDSVWKLNKGWDDLADTISAEFGPQLSDASGFGDDLF